jgi:hypothetical protein
MVSSRHGYAALTQLATARVLVFSNQVDDLVPPGGSREPQTRQRATHTVHRLLDLFQPPEQIWHCPLIRDSTANIIQLATPRSLC